MRVESEERSVLLCHGNVTTPVQIGDTEKSGYFDMMSPVTVTLSWSGYLDTSTQYLGRYEFAALTSSIGREQTEEEKRRTEIISKLKLFLSQKGHQYDTGKLSKYQFLTRGKK